MPVEKRNLVLIPEATIDGHILRVYTKVEEIVIKIYGIKDSSVFYIESNSLTGVHTLIIDSNYQIDNSVLQIQVEDELYYGIIIE